MATPTFDLESAIKGLREGKDLTGMNGQFHFFGLDSAPKPEVLFYQERLVRYF
jgi:hypothetical protein